MLLLQQLLVSPDKRQEKLQPMKGRIHQTLEKKQQKRQKQLVDPQQTVQPQQQKQQENPRLQLASHQRRLVKRAKTRPEQVGPLPQKLVGLPRKPLLPQQKPMKVPQWTP